MARVTSRLARSCTRLRWLALVRRAAARCRVGAAAQRALQCRKITPYRQAQTTRISVHPEINDRSTSSSHHTASPSIRQDLTFEMAHVGGLSAGNGRQGSAERLIRGLNEDMPRKTMQACR